MWTETCKKRNTRKMSQDSIRSSAIGTLQHNQLSPPVGVRPGERPNPAAQPTLGRGSRSAAYIPTAAHAIRASNGITEAKGMVRYTPVTWAWRSLSSGERQPKRESMALLRSQTLEDRKRCREFLVGCLGVHDHGASHYCLLRLWTRAFGLLSDGTERQHCRALTPSRMMPPLLALQFGRSPTFAPWPPMAGVRISGLQRSRSDAHD